MAVSIIRTVWTGGPSSPGLTQIAIQSDGTSNIDAAAAAVRTFWSNFAVSIPDGHTLAVEQLVEKFDEATGQLIGETLQANAPAPVTGTNIEAWAAGIGVRIDWGTSSIRNGRRVKGRTFLVPVTTTAFDTGGELNIDTRAAWLGHAIGLLDALETNGTPMVIWSRPSLKWPVGGISPVISAQVPRKPAVLRNRRDS